MQDATMFDWDDLRTILAVARGGGLARAAARLGVDQSTVFRRIKRLEDKLAVRLFERLASGYVATAEGERLLATAERMEEEANALERAITGNDCRLTGLLRITSSETTADRILTRHLAAFRTRHPDIEIELIVENRVLSLTRREADIALRPTRPSESGLFGRKLADVAWAVYGSLGYLAAHGWPLDASALAEHTLIGWDEPQIYGAATRWLATTAPASPGKRAAYRSNSLLNQLTAVRAGIGLAALPCFLGDGDAALARVVGPIPQLARELWLVTHDDLRRTARIEAFFAMMAAAIKEDRPLIEGRLAPRALTA
jgi:DNA-binding transcriptional LysR family regulator